MANYVFAGDARFERWAAARDYLERETGKKLSVKALKIAAQLHETVNGVYIGVTPPLKHVAPPPCAAARTAGKPLLRDYHPLTFGIAKFHQ